LFTKKAAQEKKEVDGFVTQTRKKPRKEHLAGASEMR
jgi:hypothetical protein